MASSSRTRNRAVAKLFKNGGVSSPEDLVQLLLAHPGLNTSELVRLSDKAQRTVERWLKQLKAEQKIEFRGASKTGGYYAMKQP